MAQKIFSFKYIAALLLTVGILILGGLNAEQKRKYVAPDDGASWIETSMRAFFCEIVSAINTMS